MKLAVLVGTAVVGVIFLAGVAILHLLGAAHISLYSFRIEGPSTAFVAMLAVLGVVGIATYMIFRKPRSTPKP